jgi:hypothetical protein
MKRQETLDDSHPKLIRMCLIGKNHTDPKILVSTKIDSYAKVCVQNDLLKEKI